MKVTMTFDLPEERDEHKMAIDGSKWFSAMFDMDQWFRSKLKYGNEFKDADEALEAGRERLHEILGENGISLNDVS